MMHEKGFDIGELIAAHLSGELTEEGRIALDAWLNTSEQNRQLLSELSSPAYLGKELDRYYRYDAEKGLDRIESLYPLLVPVERPASSGILRTLLYKRWWVAASLLILVVTTWYFHFSGNSSVQENTPVIATVQDVPAGGYKAILTLDDGSTIRLDSNLKGNISQQAGVTITKPDNGSLVYSKNNTEGNAFNTLHTPPGGQYRLQLPDGTVVWLNAASGIRYPVAFNGKERQVEITGEVYFEVAKNARQPFRVLLGNKSSTPGQWVEVLGTSFNVNAYADEAFTKTTLIEGLVRIGNEGHQVMLTPGQQLKSGKGTTMQVQTLDDATDEIAWKDGYFIMKSTDLPALARQLSRWYDIEVQLSGGLPVRKFGGKINRQVSLSSIMEALGIYGLDCRLEGKKLILRSDKSPH